ncbi:fibroblast growth factor binding protein 2a [Epinephelus moara]|uniref:fibroblast growth factor binding protein 2a n=1 Tax=Epinephelus moara TaxID=300413 RepID=UPI00214E55D0|nr:fibroblast growth factor binding protein 2a [Epinephelus moara]
MWTQVSALLLLLACCLWSADAQGERRKSIWDEPIKFSTKAKDMCTMIITGHGEYTKLRLSCQSNKRSYWCEYIGKPYTCRPYNRDPRHYFVQMMWGLRKLHNACQAPREIKPFMCKKASDDSQMVFSSGSFPRSSPEASSRTAGRQAEQPARPQPRREPARPVPPRVRTTPRASPQPVTPPVESDAKRMAQQYCWGSLQGVCSYFIGLIRK